jgi:hypothetical protein
MFPEEIVNPARFREAGWRGREKMREAHAATVAIASVFHNPLTPNVMRPDAPPPAIHLHANTTLLLSADSPTNNPPNVHP